MQVPRVQLRSFAVTAVVAVVAVAAAAAFAAFLMPRVHALPAAVPGGVPAIGAAQPAATAVQPGPRQPEHADQVVEGRDVVIAISKVKTTGSAGQPADRPLQPVVMKKVTIERVQ